MTNHRILANSAPFDPIANFWSGLGGRGALDSRVPAPLLRELENLGRQTDGEMLREGLRSWATRIERAGHPELAATAYLALLADPNLDSSIRNRLQESLDVLEGRGPLTAQLEHQAGHLTQEVLSPSSILAMGAAGAVFRITRLAVLTRLGLSPAGFLTRGPAASALANFSGFLLEAPTFTLSAHVFRGIGGEGLPNPGEFGSDLSHSYLSLGGLRLGGGLSRGLQGCLRLQSHRLLAPLFQQGGMLGGIWLGSLAEEEAGLHPERQTPDRLIDSLITLVHFNLGARVAHQAFGPNFRAWEGTMDRQSLQLSSTNLAGQVTRFDRLRRFGRDVAIQTALLAIGMPGGGGRGRETYRETTPRDARLAEISERFRDSQADIRDRARAIREYAEQLNEDSGDSNRLQDGILQLLDLAVDPRTPQAQAEYSSSPEDEGRILRTLALEAVRELLPENPGQTFARPIAQKLEGFFRNARPHLQWEYIAAPPNWPISDPRYFGPEVRGNLEILASADSSSAGVLDINRPLRDLALSLRESLRPEPTTPAPSENPTQSFQPRDQILEIWHYHLTRHPMLHRLYQAFSAGTAVAGIGLLTEYDDPSPYLDAGLATSLIFLGTLATYTPGIINRFVVRPNHARRTRWTEYMTEHSALIQTQLEMGRRFPFAALAPRSEEHVEAPPPTRVAIHEIAEAEDARAQAQAEAEWEEELDQAIQRAEEEDGE